MPLTSKGEDIMSAMRKEYGGEKAKEVFYASKNKGTISGVDRADELSPLSDRIDALNQRADTVADRHFEAARQDAVRSARADYGKVHKVEPGQQRPREAGRFMPRGDEDEGVNQRQMPRRDADGKKLSAPSGWELYDTGEDGPERFVIKKAGASSAWAYRRTQAKAEEFLKTVKRGDAEGEHNRQQPRRDDEMGRPDTELNLAKYASPAQNSAFPESPINRGRNAVES